ncbi:MAG: sulfur carrier protein ThiS [Verrucomicrobiales bacterium]|nr:sulfur carrier protein ThiS [Verrucomicrobiales bacterium]
MNVILNGKPAEVEGSEHTVATLVERLPLGKQPVLVELNGEAVLVREFKDRKIKEGDTIEVIRMVAGG